MKAISSGGTKVRLTKRSVEAAISGHLSGKRQRVWDTELPGFLLQLTPAGAASYCLRFERPDGTKGDFTIASAAKVGPDQAREAARTALAEFLLNGVDPVGKRREERSSAKRERTDTFAHLVTQFLALNRRGPRTEETRKSILNRHLLPRLGAMSLGDINSLLLRNTLSQIMEQVSRERGHFKKHQGGRRMAAAAHVLLKAIFAWGIEHQLASHNPALFRSRIDTTPIKRVDKLNDVRLAAIWHGLEEHASGALCEKTALGLKLHYLTLQRPVEILRAHLSDFDWETHTWRPARSRTKTKQTYFVPMSSEVEAIFRKLFAMSGSELAFPQERKKDRVMQTKSLDDRLTDLKVSLFQSGKLDTTDIDVYDGKRFGRTMLRKRLGVSKDVAELVINHRSRGDISNIYDYDDHEEEIRIAQERRTEEVMRIVGKRESFT